MSLTFATTKETAEIPAEYAWNVEESVKTLKTGFSIESPLFGPQKFDKIKFKLQLHSRIYGYAIAIVLVSCEAPSLNLKYKLRLTGVFVQNTSSIAVSGTIEMKCEEYVSLSISETYSVSKSAHIKSICSINCEFQIKPDAIGHPIRTLLADLNSLRLKSAFTDVTFVVGDVHLPANKLILSARSSVFEVMFSREEFTENQQNRVDIIDIDAQTFEALLDFIYTTDIKQLDEIAPELLVAAHKYDIKSLVQLCAQSMIKTVTTENAVQYLLHANMYCLAELKSKAIDTINRNAGKFTKSQEWIKHVKPDIALMTELYLDMADKVPQFL